MNADTLLHRGSATLDRLDRRIAAAVNQGRTLTQTARKLGVTLAFVRASLERTGGVSRPATIVARLPSPPQPTPRPIVDPDARDLGVDPVDRIEVEGWRNLLSIGWTVADVADDAGVDPSMVVRFCKAAASADARFDARPAELRRRDPRVELLLPVGPLTPSSPCPHRGPIPRGEPKLCLVCHQSGLDGVHPALVRDPKTEPKPEPKQPPSTEKTLTRQERAAMLDRAIRDQERDASQSEKQSRRARQAVKEAQRRADER